MQLNKQLSIKSALTIATTMLLSSPTAQSTDVESTLLLYSETNRVSASEGAVSINHEIDENQQIKVKFIFDALTGASPNGATPSDKIQTFTRPSGVGSYTIQPGDTPLDDTFHDTRVAVNGLYTRTLNRLNSVFAGANISAEFDYLSVGINSGFSHDFNNKNTHVSISGAFSTDRINPEGGVPIPFSSLPFPRGPRPRLGENETKTVYDLLLGITQTIDRKTLLRANYSRSHSSGYLNDPYKIISLVQDQASANPGEPVDYLYESRPDSRNKQSLYTQIRRYIGGNTIDLSYRYFWDDWGVTSNTVNLFYLWDLHNNKSIEPHIRWYHQSASDYYVPTLISGIQIPQYATSDYRLSKFSAITFGLQYSFPIMPTRTIKLMMEYYTQFGDSSPPGIVGSQLKNDIFPTLNSFMIRVGYNFSI